MIRVSSAAELARALKAAPAGDVITLADGTYTGAFVGDASGAASRPMYLCGGRSAVLHGEGVRSGAIHLRNFTTDSVVLGNTVTNTGLRRAKFGEGIYVGTAGGAVIPAPSTAVRSPVPIPGWTSKAMVGVTSRGNVIR